MLPVLAAPVRISTNLERQDPFASMYDAGALIAEELDRLSAELRPIASEPAGLPETSGALLDAKTEADAAQTRENIEKIGRLAADGLTAEQLNSELNTLELPEQTQMLIETIIDRAMTDRFIVKYKPSSSENFSRRAVSTSIIGDVTVITLSQKVNPKTFADELRAEGAEQYIEYIQPDFALSLANISLEMLEESEEIPDGEKKLDESKESEYSDDEPKEEPELEEAEEEIEEEELPEISNDTPVIVAVIDTGIDSSHPMLTNYMIDGWNFTNQTGTTYDPIFPSASAHGTHISGIIAQTAAQNGANIKILPLQVFDNGVAYTSDILAAIEYAIEHGASVINCSFGSTYDNPVLFEVISNSEALFVCAVGNHRRDLDVTPSYPASYRLPNLISVGSTNADGGFSYFSNYSTSLVDITAQGRDVTSTLPNSGFDRMTGTSMSAAYVSGVAAVATALGDASASELRQLLLDSADKLDNLQNKVFNGRRVNFENALAGTVGSALSLNPKDDYDVHGYQPSQGELWELFSAAGRVVQIENGFNHTLALMANGTVWAWGANWRGQLGNGTTTSSTIPVRVPGLTGVTAISSGDFHSLALKFDGSVWAWGDNLNGQLGDGTYTDRLTPVQSFIYKAKTISGGGYHSLAIDSFSQVNAWGWNSYGQLGDDSYSCSPFPVTARGPNGEWSFSDVKSVAAGCYFSLALRNDGTAWAWGNNWFGQLGNGTFDDKRTPVQVLKSNNVALENVKAISAGEVHALALLEDGTALLFGHSAFPVSVLSGTKAIAASMYNSLALKHDGTVWSWGTHSHTPNRIGTDYLGNLFTGVTAITGGVYHSFAVKFDGSVWGWGLNANGQLGTGDTIDRPAPTRVIIPPAVTEISNAHELNNIRNNVYGVYQLAADINLNDLPAPWIPIGTGPEPFKGTLDGNGYKIKNLTSSGGLFENNHGFLLNLTLENVEIVTPSNGDIGSLVSNNWGTIKGCIVRNVSIENNGWGSAGGIVGRNGGVILESAAIGGLLIGDSTVGGFVGRCTGTIKKSYAAVNVEGTGTIGGFLGIADMGSTIEQCYSLGNVSGAGQLGGFAGFAFCAIITNCYSRGNVTAATGSESAGFVPVINTSNVINSYSVSDNPNGFFVRAFRGGAADCFFDSDLAGPASLGLPGARTSAQMKMKTTYENAGWDFAEIWGIDGCYPALRGVSTPGTANNTASSIEFTTTQNQTYTIALNASDIDTFSGKIYTINYVPARLQLLDFAAQTASPNIAAGAVAGTPLTIVSHANGVLKFTVDRNIPSGYSWSGVLTMLQFRALGNGATVISVAD
jgi:alpha-tubulin suppressor-like RCC1 family protein